MSKTQVINWRVALTRSSHTPDHLVTMIASDKESQKVFENHSSFIQWLTAPQTLTIEKDGMSVLSVTSSEAPLTFAMGDTVRYIGDDGWPETMIIKEAKMNLGDPRIFHYSTTAGSWVPGKDLVLVSKATPESLQVLHNQEFAEYGW